MSISSCGLFTTADYQSMYNAATSYYNRQATKTDGAYLGIASTDEEASKLAEKSGYRYYKWYRSSCQVYGYSSNPN